MPKILLNPAEITATYHEGVLTIEASGEEDQITDIQIVELPSTEPITPAPFYCAVEGEFTPALGMFPYEVSGEFDVGPVVPTEIKLKTPDGGWRQIPIFSTAPH